MVHYLLIIFLCKTMWSWRALKCPLFFFRNLTNFRHYPNFTLAYCLECREYEDDDECSNSTWLIFKGDWKRHDNVFPTTTADICKSLFENRGRSRSRRWRRRRTQTIFFFFANKFLLKLCKKKRKRINYYRIVNKFWNDLSRYNVDSNNIVYRIQHY